MNLLEEKFVDEENDLQVAREDIAEKRNAPFFQSLREQGVVRVGEGAGDDRPGFYPRHVVFVDQQALEFDDGDGGVGVVELDGDFFGEGFPVFVVALEAANDVAKRASDEEVLLEQAEFLAGLGVIVRVKDL